MLRSLTSKQFFELVAYKKIEPFNGFRADYLAASIVTMVHNAAADAKHQKKITDFLPPWSREEEPPRQQMNTRAQQISIIKALALAYSAPAEERR